MLSGFPIARPLALTLFGFLQRFFLTVNQVSILATNIENIHVELVEWLRILSLMRSVTCI